MPLHGSTLKPLVRLGAQPGDCWEWLGKIATNGYAMKTFAGRDMMAKRWVWLTLFGPLPDSVVVSMTCQNNACVNPAHMVARTMADAQRDGLGTKLTPQDVQAIRRARRETPRPTMATVAYRHNVSPQLVRDIWTRRAWKPVRTPPETPPCVATTRT